MLARAFDFRCRGIDCQGVALLLARLRILKFVEYDGDVDNVAHRIVVHEGAMASASAALMHACQGITSLHLPSACAAMLPVIALRFPHLQSLAVTTLSRDSLHAVTALRQLKSLTLAVQMSRSAMSRDDLLSADLLHIGATFCESLTTLSSLTNLEHLCSIQPRMSLTTCFHPTYQISAPCRPACSVSRWNIVSEIHIHFSSLSKSFRGLAHGRLGRKRSNFKLWRSEANACSPLPRTCCIINRQSGTCIYDICFTTHPTSVRMRRKYHPAHMLKCCG